MSRIKDIDYAYAVSRVRAVERGLLDSNRLTQIAEASNTAEALRLIYDAGYRQNADYDLAFSQSMDEAYALIDSIAPNLRLVEMFRVEQDYYNLKVLRKAELLQTDLDHLLSNRGRTPLQKLKEAVISRQGERLSSWFSQALAESVRIYTGQKDIQRMDMVIDWYCFLEITDYAKRCESLFIQQLLAIRIDLINIKTIFRISRIGADKSLATQAILAGGTLEPDFLFSCIGETQDEMVQSFSLTPYGALISETISALAGSENVLSALETQCTNYLMRYLQQAKRITFGPEPLVAYLMAKECEVTQLRTILVCKNSGMPADEIKRRLSISYV